MTFGRSWLFCLQNIPCLVSFWCMFGGHVEVRTFYIGSLRIKLILAPTEFAKISLTLSEPI